MFDFHFSTKEKFGKNSKSKMSGGLFRKFTLENITQVSATKASEQKSIRNTLKECYESKKGTESVAGGGCRLVY